MYFHRISGKILLFILKELINMEMFNKKSIFLDFNNQYCTNTNELINSETFYKILKSFIHQTKKKKSLSFHL